MKQFQNSVTPDEVLNPSSSGGRALAAIIGQAGDAKASGLLQGELDLVTTRIKNGDLSDLEAILTTQSYVLNALFNDLIAKGSAALFDKTFASELLSDRPKLMFNMALKAQNQCRATIAAIAELKNPKRTTFVRNQLNSIQMQMEEIREGVENNGSKALDGSTATEAESIDSFLASLGESDRPEDCGGQEDLLSELI